MDKTYKKAWLITVKSVHRKHPLKGLTIDCGSSGTVLKCPNFKIEDIDDVIEFACKTIDEEND